MALKVKIGDVIRSYDFKPMLDREDVFVEGIVERKTNEKGFDAYQIRVTRDSCSNKFEKFRVGAIVYVPIRMSSGFEYPGRILNLSRPVAPEDYDGEAW